MDGGHQRACGPIFKANFLLQIQITRFLVNVTSGKKSTSDWKFVYFKENVKTQLCTCMAQDLLMVIVQLVSPRSC